MQRRLRCDQCRFEASRVLVTNVVVLEVHCGYRAIILQRRCNATCAFGADVVAWEVRGGQSAAMRPAPSAPSRGLRGSRWSTCDSSPMPLRCAPLTQEPHVWAR